MSDRAGIFDSAARRVRRHHAWRAAPDDRWLLARMWTELSARIAPRPSAEILLIGDDFGALGPAFGDDQRVLRIDPGHAPHWGSGVEMAEDQMELGPRRVDLVLACGTLDSLHDVPGALLLARRALKPGGRFLAAFLGSGSLSLLRTIVHCEDGPQIARLHPQIDVRIGGDLLARAGFVEPVADTEEIATRYRDWQRYLADLRANGIGNCLRERFPANKALLNSWFERFESAKDEAGRASETFCPIYLNAYAPARAGD